VRAIKRAEVSAPVKVGDIILRDVADTGVGAVAAREAAPTY
jgi:CxxC motif-containing protein